MIRTKVALIVVAAFMLAACSTAAPPAPTPTPFVAPTEGPTLPPPAGSGVITFGAAGTLNNDTLKVNPSKSTFKVGVKKIAWSAEFREAAGATSLTWILAKVSGSGTERIVWRQNVDVSNPAFDILANTGDLGLLVDRKPGTYVMRYLREATILAEGKFTLVK